MITDATIVANAIREKMAAARRNTSGYSGVSYDRKYGHWTAVVYLDRKKVRLGRYDTPEEAAIAVQCYREKHGFMVYHGEL